MSTRKHKTRQRKLARQEDRDAMIRLIQRLDEAGDPKDWEALNLDDMRVKYGYDKGKEE